MSTTRSAKTSTTRASWRRTDNMPVVQLTWCPLHGTEPENMFCEDHGKIICTVCRRLNHTKCRSVVPITEASIRLSGRTSPSDTRHSIKRLIDFCGAVAKERHWDLNELDNKKKEVLEAISGVKRRFITKIDKLVVDLTADLERTVTLEKAEVAGHVVALSDSVRTLEEDLVNIRRASQENKELPLFIAVQKALDNQKHITETFIQIHKEAHKVSLAFDANEAFNSAMNGIASLGSVDTKRSAYNVVPHEFLSSDKTKSKTISIKEHEIRKPAQRRKASFARDIYIRSPDDAEQCWITGMALLCGGGLIVADHNNSCLKFISPNGSLTNKMPLKSPPFDVTLLDQASVYVSLPEMKEVWSVGLKGETNMERNNVIKTNFECNGLAAFEGNLAVTSIPDKSVYMMNTNGAVKWTVNLDQTRNPLFEWPWYVAVNVATECLFVTDRRNNSLTKLGFDGKIKHVRKLNGKGPRGATVDDFGNLFMCFFMSDEIEISADTLYDQNILLTKRDGVQQPQTVVYDSLSGNLFIATDNADKLLVYKVT